MYTPIYHITHLNNLTYILNYGELTAFNRLKEKQVSYTNIAHEQIQYRRATKRVPCVA